MENSAFNLPDSPIAVLGTITILVAFVVAAYAVATGFIGNAQRSRRLVLSSVTANYAFASLMSVASMLLIYAFVTHDYSIKYVAATSDTTMSLWYKVTAYWGALEGSLMFWVTVLALFSAVAVRANVNKHSDMIGYVVGIIMLTQVFFLAILIYNKNPFATFLTEAPMDGRGLNPLLQTYWMVIHPPALYTGFVAATIPFAFGMAALLSGRLDDTWLASVRSWTLICWFFLSLGLILGGRWAYEELGWGGYWAWDPVENAALIPWFTATAFLHSVIIQEQRGMMKVWNLALVIITFFLTIFGTFMTRSGIVQSVHAFGEDNTLAMLFIIFMVVIMVASFGLVLYRLPRLRSKATFESFWSREYAFLLNNWILLGCAMFVLFATMFPTLSESVTGQRITVGPPFFNRIMVPLGMTLLFLAGAAPLMAWRRTTKSRLNKQFIFPAGFAVVVMGLLAAVFPAVLTTNTEVILPERVLKAAAMPVSWVNFGLCAFVFASIGQEFFRGIKVRIAQTKSDPFTSAIALIILKRRKYGGYVIHAGVAVMFIGFAGKAYETMEDATVPMATVDGDPAAQFKVRGYTFQYDKLNKYVDEKMTEFSATVAVSLDGTPLGVLKPAKRDYPKSEQPTTEVDLISSLANDVYIILTGFDEKTAVANFRVYINPLINWVWIGFTLLFFGTLICLIPQSLVDWVRSGSAAGAVALAIVLGAVALPGAAMAQDGVEHSEQLGHNVGVSGAHMFRPDDPQYIGKYKVAAEAKVASENPGLEAKSPEFASKVKAELAPVVGLAEQLMVDLVCLCGGCSRENISECRCGFAAGEREKLLAVLASFDLSTKAGRDKAYNGAIQSFVSRHGTHVLQTPPDSSFNRLSWILPYIGLVGGLVFLFGVGRRWVRRGAGSLNETGDGSAELSSDEQRYVDQLDDELRDTD